VLGRLLEQQTSKPSSTSPISDVQVVGAGTLHADAVFSSAWPPGVRQKVLSTTPTTAMPNSCSQPVPLHISLLGHRRMPGATYNKVWVGLAWPRLQAV
jgi:hypothetical protein